jgi:hypothetical protein
MGYQLEGRLLEVCDCNVLCPCWVGENPDNPTCQAVQAYRIDRGTIDGVDVSGLTVAEMDDIPGNILEGNIRGAFFGGQEAGVRGRGATGGNFVARSFPDPRLPTPRPQDASWGRHLSVPLGECFWQRLEEWRRWRSHSA